MRDYARKRSPQSKKHQRDQSWLNNLFLLLAFVFVLCAIFHFVDTHHGQQSVVASAVVAQSQVQTTAPITASTSPSPHSEKQVLAAKKPTPSPDAQPKYDFYKLLPEMTVTVPDTNQ